MTILVTIKQPFHLLTKSYSLNNVFLVVQYELLPMTKQETIVEYLKKI